MLKSVNDKVERGISGPARSLLAIIDQCLVSGTSFLSTVVVGRTAGVSELGVFSLTISVAVMIVVFQEAFVVTPYTVFFPQLNESERRGYTGAIIVQFAVISAFITLLVGAVGLGAWLLGASSIWMPVLALAVTCPCWMLRDLARRISFAELRVIGPVFMDAVISIIQLSGLVILAWQGVLTVVNAILVVGITQGICSLTWFVFLGPSWRYDHEASRAGWRRNWQFGRWTVASRMTGMGHAYSLHWLLVFYAGSAATGFFAACATLVALSNPVLMGIGNLLAAKTARHLAWSGTEALRATVRRASFAAIIFSSVFALILTLFREPLIGLLYGEAYLESAAIIPLLAAASVASSFGMGADHGLRAMNRQSSVLIASLVGLATTLTMTIPLLAWSPLKAAALGLLVGVAASAACRCWAFSKILRLASRTETDE